ncbi:hypothetical protein EYF80_049850 [Liparis tanakae]|uniref:Uncharacterized protein n=1 Tax=Liparis tanakae TaxID=230148 RepID=A0A4Z2FGT7_9TELE|nr:hypothetical protein EYF80_049850 [Liparis tanakae]
MSPSAAAREAGKELVRKTLREVLVGREDPDGFFATCVSVLGPQETRAQFRSLIRPLGTAHGALHATLASIYEGYFTEVSVCLLNICEHNNVINKVIMYAF